VVKIARKLSVFIFTPGYAFVGELNYKSSMLEVLQAKKMEIFENLDLPF
jgi:hypothetical protein